jgi:UPF0271 protein
MKITLNADMGESFGAWTMGSDAALLPLIQAGNFACGFHAGDPVVMRAGVRAAKAAGVEIGAHPGFPDLQGFGRRAMVMSPAEVEAMVLYQIGALDGVARAEGVRVTHVKAHGMLSNMAAEDDALAGAIARAVKAYGRDLILLGTACTALVRAGEAAGLRVAHEVFADRTHSESGALTPRSQPNAMIHDAEAAVAQILRFLAAGGVVTPSGKVLPTPIHSVCVHGDGPKALALAAAVGEGLRAKGVELAGLTAVA